MPKKKQVSPNQLRLFMTPREIMSEYAPNAGDYLPGETPEQLWARKGREAEKNGLQASLAEHGAQVPVSLRFVPGLPNRVVGGHHRIAAMHRINPDQFIPVTYESNTMNANWEERDIERSLPEHLTRRAFSKEGYDADDNDDGSVM